MKTTINGHTVQQLISEAVSVASETGLSPMQLLKQRNALLEAILEMRELSERETPPSEVEFIKVDNKILKAIRYAVE